MSWSVVFFVARFGWGPTEALGSVFRCRGANTHTVAKVSSYGRYTWLPSGFRIFLAPRCVYSWRSVQVYLDPRYMIGDLYTDGGAGDRRALSLP